MDIIDTTVKNLLKFVVRNFYPKQYVLVFDAVIFHSVLFEDDLAHLLGIQRKEVRALIQKLLEDRLLTMFRQQESFNNARSVTRTYYYIKYTETIDAIKWKIHQVVEGIKHDLSQHSNPQGFVCPVCQTKYSQLEAISLVNFERTAYMCSLCDEPLVEDDSGKMAQKKQQRLTKLMNQLEPIIAMLKKIDDSKIEDMDFEMALARLIPPSNNSIASYTILNKKNRKMFTPGEMLLDNVSSQRAGQKSQATLHVSITVDGQEDEETNVEKRKKEAEEKRKQNALPEWHEQSTVGFKELGKLDDDDVEMKEEVQEEVKSAEVKDNESEKALAEYYAQLAKREGDEEEEEEEDDFDEADFEDL